MASAAKVVLIVALTIPLSVYGLRCGATATPEQSMQCCNPMRCHSPHNYHDRHNQDCCNTMPEMYAVLGQPAALLGISFSPVTLAIVPSFSNSLSESAASIMVGSHSHDPPKLRSAMVLALRI